MKGKEQGYGIIYKSAMCDSRLSIGEKALYAYLCTYAGGKDSCYPSRSLISHELGINKNTVTKYIASLRRYGYIKLAVGRSNGRFVNNRYILTKQRGVTASFSEERTGAGAAEAGRTVSERTGSGETVTKNNSCKNNRSKKNSDKNNIHKSGYVCVKKTGDSSLDRSIKIFADMRAELGRPLTGASMDLVMERLSSITSDRTEQKRIVDRSVMNSWLHLYPLKDGYAPPKDRYAPPQNPEPALGLGLPYGV